MLLETKKILNNSFDLRERRLLNEFSVIIKNDYRNVNSQRKIWQYDQSIGGLGGYATPLNPLINPFNHLDNYRNVFRSLQYARCDMFCCDRPRHIITDAALHIETLVKLLLSKNKLIKFIYNNRQFGTNIMQLHNENTIDKILYERLNNLRVILNLAKHDTDENNNITFDYIDAIVFYFESRKVGNELLKKLDYGTCGKTCEIKDKF